MQVQVRRAGSNGSHAHKREVDDAIELGAGGDKSINDRTNGAAAVSRNDSGGPSHEGCEGLEALCSNCDVLCAEDAAAIGTPPPTRPPSVHVHVYRSVHCRTRLSHLVVVFVTSTRPGNVWLTSPPPPK